MRLVRQNPVGNALVVESKPFGGETVNESVLGCDSRVGRAVLVRAVVPERVVVVAVGLGVDGRGLAVKPRDPVLVQRRASECREVDTSSGTAKDESVRPLPEQRDAAARRHEARMRKRHA